LDAPYFQISTFPNGIVEAGRLYRLAAAQGHAGAQFILGSFCNKGTGVSQDFVEAVRLWLLAAAQGHAGAQFMLGCCYAEGNWGLGRVAAGLCRGCAAVAAGCGAGPC
jgi:TPR repeat protein